MSFLTLNNKIASVLEYCDVTELFECYDATLSLQPRAPWFDAQCHAMQVITRKHEKVNSFPCHPRLPTVRRPTCQLLVSCDQLV